MNSTSNLAPRRALAGERTRATLDGSPARRDRLALRRIAPSRLQIQTALGLGRVLEFPSEALRLELFLPPWAGPDEAASDDQFDTAVRCRPGVIATDGQGAMWCLLGGVPLPAFDASLHERELRIAAALSRAPEKLVQILGGLALMPARALAPTNKSISGLAGPDRVSLMLRVSRQDVTVYCRAIASPAVWLHLLEHLPAVFPPAVSERRRRRDDALTISVPVELARGRLQLASLARIREGDVLRLPTLFNVQGTGTLRVGEFNLDVRWRERDPQHVFEILSMTHVHMASLDNRDRLRTHQTDSASLLEPAPMNIDQPGTTFDEDEGEQAASAHGFSRRQSAERDHESAEESDDDLDPEDLDDDLDPDDPDESVSEGRHPSSHDALDRMAVTVVAELGTLTVTLAALKAIEPGMLIQLGSRSQGEVVLRALDGPPFAHAELVDIGGHIGLQITKVLTP